MKRYLWLLLPLILINVVVAKEITPTQILEMRKDGTAFVILDIRSEDAYKSGHLVGAHHVGWSGSAFTSSYAPYLVTYATIVVVVCDDGVQSPRAAKVLSDAGYSNAGHLVGGMDAGGDILSVSDESSIEAWHVIKSLFSAQPLPRLK